VAVPAGLDLDKWITPGEGAWGGARRHGGDCPCSHTVSNPVSCHVCAPQCP